MKGLKHFLHFDLDMFLIGKKLVYLRAAPWLEQGNDLGCKVTLLIVEDKTVENVDNIGEQLVIKVRNCSPTAFSKWRSFYTEVIVTDVERAIVYGDYQNQLSIIAKVAVTGEKAT